MDCCGWWCLIDRYLAWLCRRDAMKYKADETHDEMRWDELRWDETTHSRSVAIGQWKLNEMAESVMVLLLVLIISLCIRNRNCMCITQYMRINNKSTDISSYTSDPFFILYSEERNVLMSFDARLFRVKMDRVALESGNKKSPSLYRESLWWTTRRFSYQFSSSNANRSIVGFFKTGDARKGPERPATRKHKTSWWGREKPNHHPIGARCRRRTKPESSRRRGHRELCAETTRTTHARRGLFCLFICIPSMVNKLKICVCQQIIEVPRALFMADCVWTGSNEIRFLGGPGCFGCPLE